MSPSQTMSSPPTRTAPAGTGVVHSIGIAGIRVVRSPDKIRTVVGSCIAVCVFDQRNQIGGMAHVILPDSTEGSGDPAKFADTAVDMLLEQMLEAGADKKRIRAKIAGGAAMFGDKHTGGLGERNAVSVKTRLTRHAISVIASATGANQGRKVLLDPASGDVQVEVIGQEPQVI